MMLEWGVRRIYPLTLLGNKRWAANTCAEDRWGCRMFPWSYHILWWRWGALHSAGALSLDHILTPGSPASLTLHQRGSVYTQSSCWCEWVRLRQSSFIRIFYSSSSSSSLPWMRTSDWKQHKNKASDSRQFTLTSDLALCFLGTKWEKSD